MNNIHLMDGIYKDMVVKFPSWANFKNVPNVENYAKRKNFSHFSILRPKSKDGYKVYAHYKTGKTIKIGVLKDNVYSLPDYVKEE